MKSNLKKNSVPVCSSNWSVKSLCSHSNNTFLKTMAIKRYSHTRTLFSSLGSRKLPGNAGGL